MDIITTTVNTRWQVGARVDGVPHLCWCGQDLEYVKHPGCPRCGTARPQLFDSNTPGLAA